MTPIQRRRLWICFRIVLLAYVAVVAQTAGYLTRIEHVLQNQRAAWCQYFMPAPSPVVVHLDIDENAISQIGRWPWHRDVTAEVLDEVRLAGPRVLAMDILFAEPEELAYDKSGHEIDRDKILTKSVRRFDRVLTPVSFTFETPVPRDIIYRRITQFLTHDMELSSDECIDRLRAKGINPPDLPDHAKQAFLIARAEVIYDRICQELCQGLSAKAIESGSTVNIDNARQALKKKLFPHGGAQFTGSVLDRLFDEEYERVVRERALERFSIEMPPRVNNVLPVESEITPILSISNAAKYSAFVDYLPDHEDGTVRRVPLLANFHGRLVPQMGLATACAWLGVDIHDLRLGPDSITIPRAVGGDIVIPTRTLQHSSFGPVSYLMEVPMFGKPGSWQTMYDFPRHQTPAQHISVYEVWRIIQTKRRIAANDAVADGVLAAAFRMMDHDESRSRPYTAAPLQGQPKRQLIDKTIGELHDLIEGTSSIPVSDLGPAMALDLHNEKTAESNLHEILQQNAALQQQLLDLRADLRKKLMDKAVFLGGTATGNVDKIPTSLFPQCPGVVVHGAIVNAILTGKMYRVAPPWVTAVLTAVIALLTGILASTLSPAKGFMAMVILSGGYLVVNGLLLFDHNSVIVGAAGPAFGGLFSWLLITLFNFISEVTERARITRRFSSYVDPSLVNYVIKHPEHSRFGGERREMTMGFTDLAGFTTLTESLGPRTVPLLSEYMNLMIPKIREHKGYVSRLMGDGIYFFYGAPEEDPDHALHAVSTVLAMHEAMDTMNATLPERGFPILTMRAGLCSGKVIVGDAGSNEFHDYTAVGDSVNTAARLETANKFFGTKALVGARTIELLNGQFLFRPIANVRVAGKTKGVMVYEPLSALERASDLHRRLADLSVQVVSTFQCGNFQDCVTATQALDHEIGPNKFAELYRKLSVDHEKALPDDFDGQVVLTEK
ncbi:MAG TPA: adenylate/guanylate cyclase domain-containing protein [Tepidisphaeraceae bacterium]|nr:adenylate/guanylate cyclase domain-containing protein [Tepidisphaeraceae bacterium]